MAWPCMSRVCCWARFWNQVDRSDLAVPLTIHNYSDMWEMEAQSSGPGLGHPSRGPRDLEPPDYSGLQDAPLPTVSLYKQDFKAWPLPTKQVSHWRSDGRGHLGSSGRQKKFKRRDRREGSVAQLQEEVFPADWCRQHHPAHTQPRAPKAAGEKQAFMITGTAMPPIPMATGCRAALNRDHHRRLESLQEGGSAEEYSPLKRAENNTSVWAQEQIVRSKRLSNPSAIFQSGSQIFSL